MSKLLAVVTVAMAILVAAMGLKTTATARDGGVVLTANGGAPAPPSPFKNGGAPAPPSPFKNGGAPAPPSPFKNGGAPAPPSPF